MTQEIYLKYKSDLDKTMQRINAWYVSEIVDRPPVFFSNQDENSHNNVVELDKKFTFKNLEERWFDAEYQVERYKAKMPRKEMLGDALPFYMPNMGPNFFAALYGGAITFSETTSWTEHILRDYNQYPDMQMDGNKYFDAIERITKRALEECEGNFIVGYTDLHPGLDCMASFRGSEQLCFDLYEEDEHVKKLSLKTIDDLQKLFAHYNKLVTEHKQLSVSWLGVPSSDSMHIPSCDFSYMISPAQFEEFNVPILQNELKIAKHNVFHLDGIGVANHIDRICDFPEINAFQWEPGVGSTVPFTYWTDLIKKIRKRGKSILVYVKVDEIDDFMGEIPPEGILLVCDTSNKEIQQEILKRVEKWKR